MAKVARNRPRLLLNCDMGESFGAWRMGLDEQVMPLVDLANIACGFHASDPMTMTHTVLLARHAGTTIGAHPGYPDLTGFGRRSMQCHPQEIVSMMQYQIGALAGIARAHGVKVSYVKPHGALYNDMMKDHDILRAVLEGVTRYDPSLPLMLMATADNRPVQAVAAEFGAQLMFEAFADRAYDANGFLISRGVPGAVYEDEARILGQTLQLAETGMVRALDGTRVRLEADTLCVHGDNAESVRAVQHIRTELNRLYGNAG
ncbi:LamB/YcsF family protein [Marinobacterium sp. 3-1745]|uniref:5-oxoprolinase subunit A n=2 Tax=Marinobacterium marinum TaxID=2756129 RepID=A0A7W1WZ12_9GAMM|nr:LamB/YcsF family protein [Marinobacterium marinum]